MRRSMVVVLLVGLVGGFGLSELRHAVAEPKVVVPPAEPKQGVMEAVEHVAQKHELLGQLTHERAVLVRSTLERLENEPLSNKEKVKYVRILGLLRAHEAIPYLIKNIDLEDEGLQGTFSDALRGIGSLYPCYGALREMGEGAIPALVEAFITGLLDVEQIADLQIWLRADKRRAQIAYIYTQGYVAATKHDPIRREVAVHLIRTLGEKVASDELPYPPRWMAADEAIKSAP